MLTGVPRSPSWGYHIQRGPRWCAGAGDCAAWGVGKQEVSHGAALWTDNKDILVMLSDMDINAIAGTLKLYFRELPEPLLTDRLYPAFMEGIGKGLGTRKGSGHAASTFLPAVPLM